MDVAVRMRWGTSSAMRFGEHQALDGLVERVVVVERPRCPRCVAVDAVDAGSARRPGACGAGSGFGKRMQTSYSDAFTARSRKRATFATYDHVYIDVNNVCTSPRTENEDAFGQLFALLDLTMRRTRPHTR